MTTRRPSSPRPLPPREPRPAPELTRSTWLTARLTPATLLALLDLDLDPTVAIGAAATLGRVIAYASPWALRLPYPAWVAAYGLLWGLESGHILPADAAALRRLPVGALCLLLGDIAAAQTGSDTTDVPPYITARAPGR